MFVTEKKLTRYQIGSWRESLVIAIPLILSSMSANGMIFIDKAILSLYSVEAMNAVGYVTVISAVLMIGLLSLVLIAEVFVGQYNGSDQKHKIGEPVWQMIWFSLGSFIIFVPFGLMGEVFIPSNLYELGDPYYKIYIFSGPFSLIVGSIASFYVGRGRPMVVTALVFLGNLINLALDFVLIFGVEGFIPAMGTAGAAWATAISLVFQATILFILFIEKKNRDEFGTGHYKFNYSIFKQCVKVGLPNAFAHIIAISAWALFFNILSDNGDAYFTVLTICHNYIILSFAFTEGIGKSVAALVSNLIGSGNYDAIPKVLISCGRLALIVCVVIFVPMVCYPEFSEWLFVKEGTFTGQVYENFKAMLQDGLRWMWFMFLANFTFMIFMNQLIAAGDTRYVMVANIVSAWLFLILPTYVFVEILGYSSSWTWRFMTMDFVLFGAILSFRYRSGIWKTKRVIEFKKNPEVL